MSFYSLAKEHFFGQDRILKELSIYARAIKRGENMNLLLIAPSGWGKTFLAYLFIEYVDPEFKSSYKYVPRKGRIKFQPQARFHLLDEAHMLKDPEELYNILDSDSHTVIIATNEFDSLKEPLVNRCLLIRIEPYSSEALAKIICKTLHNKNTAISYDWCIEITNYCRNSPRISRITAKRLAFVFKEIGVPTTKESLHSLIGEMLGAGPGGFTVHDRQYLSALRKCGGTAGLRTLKGLIKLPYKTILYEIEPFLINKELIMITSRGRTLINDNFR